MLDGESWKTNQMNIFTRGSLRAIAIACGRYRACCASTRLSAPRFRLVAVLGDPDRDVLPAEAAIEPSPRRGSSESVTFGQRLICSGAWFTGNGYGCCAQASNRMRGAAFAISCMNVPGATVSVRPATWRLRPLDEVSPTATWACGFPA